MPKRGRRGYPTAILIGLDADRANIWLVYSESVKQGKTILETENDKTGYKHNEEIIKAVRELLPEGFNQLIVASPEKPRLIDHINRSHGWLSKRVTIRELQGKATTASDVVQLVKNNRLQESVEEGTGETNERMIERLEKALNIEAVLFTPQELSEALHSEKTPEFILVSEKFDAAWRGNCRYQSLIQRSKNLGATFAIVKHDSSGYARVEQLGGFVCVIRQ